MNILNVKTGFVIIQTAYGKEMVHEDPYEDNYI